MESNLVLGFGFVMLGAVCNGLFALPSKFTRGFAWENTWGAFFLITKVLIPAVVAAFLLKGLLPTWAQVNARYVVIPVLFGFLWGCGVILFGIGVSRIGMSLAYSIIMGLCALLGSLMPLFLQHYDQVFTAGGIAIIVGILTCVLGVAVCGRAGVLRERSQACSKADAADVRAQPGTMFTGLVICVMAGAFSACCNLAFSYGDVLKNVSETQFSNPPWAATLAVWLLVFWGGFLASGSYAAYRLSRNGTWRNFLSIEAPHDMAMSTFMAIGHFCTLFLYGLGAHYLGRLGTSVGWGVNMSSALIVANVMGFATAEWKGSSRTSRLWILSGLAVLIAGIIVLGIGNRMQQ